MSEAARGGEPVPHGGAEQHGGEVDLAALLARAGVSVRVTDRQGRAVLTSLAEGEPAAVVARADPAPADPVPREAREVRVVDREARNHLVLRLPVASEQGEDWLLTVSADVTEVGRGSTVVASAGTQGGGEAGPSDGAGGPASATLTAVNADLAADNAALRRSNRDLSEFAYVVSHDLAAPLRVVSGYVQLLARRYGDALDERAERWIDWTVDGVERMEELLAGLLDYSRLDSEGVAHGPVDLGAVLADVAAAMDDEGAEALEVRSGDLPVVEGDRSQLRQLLANLLSNAGKFRHPDRAPVVEVRAWRQGPRWWVAVADNGVGIPAEQRARALRMFGRLHAREEASGTGVGLAIAQRVVERHGGTLAIDDSDLGGARLSFDLPASDAPTRGDGGTSGAGTHHEEGRP
ncbi:MAG: sensor histidine kinase [Actinomycetota bacterium]